MIRVESLAKRFGRVTALDGVSFEAQNGRVTGLLGPNGAGKTTALRIVSTLVRPDAGTAKVDELDAQLFPAEARSRLGVLPDSRGLYPRLTAREHLLYFGALQGIRGKRLARRIEELVDLLDMGSIVDRRVGGFSQGERTKVAIGRALVHEPQNVILDEATNGLDVMSARAVRAAIRRLAESGVCVLFSSHVMAEVAQLCEDLVIVSGGKVAISGPTSTLLEAVDERDLESAFVRIISAADRRS